MLAAMELLAALWQDYAERTPQARAIHAALAEAGEVVVNDHIALRGLAGTRLGIEELAADEEAAGLGGGGSEGPQRPRRRRRDGPSSTASEA